MPSIWEDVQFDEASATHLQEELIATARALGEATAVLMEDIPVVTEDWLGRFRETFDPEAVRLLGALAMLSESLMASAAEVMTMLEDAKAEQARRENLRRLAIEEAERAAAARQAEAERSQPTPVTGPR